MGNYQTNRGLEQAIKSNRGKGGGYSNQYSLNFDGIDNYVNCRNGSNYQFTTAITLSAWVKPAVIDPSPSCRIIDKYDTSPYSGWSLWQSTATPGKWRGTFGILEPSSPTAIRTQVEFAVPSTDWQHITVTFNGLTGDLKLYHNGSLVNTDTNAPGSIINTNTEEIIIGASSITAGYYDGNIDEVAIWDVALDDATIESIFNDGTPNSLKLSKSYTAGGGIDNSGDLKAWWRMGDSGIYFNNNWEIPEQTKIDNFSSHCFDFDGIDDFISTVTLTDLGMAATNTMTVSFWVNFDTLALYDTIMGATTTTLPSYGDGFGFWIHSSGGGNPIYFFINDNVTQANSSPTITNTGEWYHVVGVYDGTLVSDNIKLYINGSVQSNTGTLTANITGVTRTINIGKIYRNVENCDGKIDNVSIWSVALDDHTVNSIYNAGKPNDLTLAASYTTGSGTDKSGDLQGYWRIGEGSTWDGGTSKWTIPDASTNSNTGTSQNMDEEDKINFAPDNENQGLSDGMGEDAPSGRDPDVP